MSIDVGSPKFRVTGQTELAAIYTGFVMKESVLQVQTKTAEGVPYQPTSVSASVWSGATGYEVQGSPFPATWNAVDSKWEVVLTPDGVGTLVIRWRSSDNDTGFQMLIVLDARMAYLMLNLRALLDKSIKALSETWAFTDSDLFMYLVNSLLFYNSIPPATSLTLEMMPPQIDHIIIEIAMVYGIQAQMMFSIDTDVTYSDQGMSLNIEHFGRLSTLYDKIMGRVETLIRRYKFNYKSTRTVMAFNPERARGWIWSQRLAAGFPFFSLGGMATNIFRG